VLKPNICCDDSSDTEAKRSCCDDPENAIIQDQADETEHEDEKRVCPCCLPLLLTAGSKSTSQSSSAQSHALTLLCLPDRYHSTFFDVTCQTTVSYDDLCGNRSHPTTVLSASRTSLSAEELLLHARPFARWTIRRDEWWKIGERNRCIVRRLFI
jgi:hypothetical protein